MCRRQNSIMPIFFQSTRCLCSEQALLCLSWRSHCLLFPFGTCLMVKTESTRRANQTMPLIARKALYSQICQCSFANVSCTMVHIDLRAHCSSQQNTNLIVIRSCYTCLLLPSYIYPSPLVLQLLIITSTASLPTARHRQNQSTYIQIADSNPKRCHHSAPSPLWPPFWQRPPPAPSPSRTPPPKTYATWRKCRAGPFPGPPPAGSAPASR